MVLHLFSNYPIPLVLTFDRDFQFDSGSGRGGNEQVDSERRDQIRRQERSVASRGHAGPSHAVKVPLAR